MISGTMERRKNAKKGSKSRLDVVTEHYTKKTVGLD